MPESLETVPYAASASVPPSQCLVVSGLGFEETLARLKEAIQAEDLWLIHEIDPQKLAERGGFRIQPTRQLLCFHPRYLARLLASDPSALVEVPLKLIIMQTPTGSVTVQHLQVAPALARYAGLEGLAAELAEILQRIMDRIAGPIRNASEPSDPLETTAPLVPSDPGHPSDTPAHRAFDFWLGDWNVRTPDGKLAGRNQVESEYRGYVLHEHYTTDRGYRGESLNAYDSTRNVWHQTWVDTEGALLLLEGGLQGGRMILEGATPNPGAPATRHRISWTPNPDGSVRQLWESTDAQGLWHVAFDGSYTRRP